MFNLKMFDSVEDLRKLTGLSENELYDHGFDTDDWDAGFQSNQALTMTEHDDDCGEFEEPVPGAYWLVHEMEDYCVGYDCVKYGGKYYYMVYHA